MTAVYSAAGMRYPESMNLIQTFEADCKAAGVKPTDVLQRAGVHRSLWWKWKEGKVSPTLKSFEAVSAKLGEIVAAGRAGAAA